MQRMALTVLCSLCPMAALAAGPDLFAKLDRDGDGQITAQEVPESSVRLFERLIRTSDQDDDGRLSAEEFTSGLSSTRDERPLEQKESSRLPDAASIEAMVRRLDGNQDGRIEAHEVPPPLAAIFRSALSRGDKDGDGALGPKEIVRVAPMLSRLGRQDRPRNGRELFGRLDANQDGKVVLDEVPDEHREKFEQALARADEDEDQALSQREFMRHFGRMDRRRRPTTDSPRRPPTRPGSRLMKALDTDSDGQLSADEIATAGASLSALDRDGDGRIARREWLDDDPEERMRDRGRGGPDPGRRGDDLRRRIRVMRRMLADLDAGDAKESPSAASAADTE